MTIDVDIYRFYFWVSFIHHLRLIFLFCFVFQAEFKSQILRNSIITPNANKEAIWLQMMVRLQVESYY